MAAVTITYGASATITCSLASLASSTTFVAGQESSAISNSSSFYDDVFLAGQITTGTSPTASTNILVYVFSALDDTPTWPDVMDGTDSAETLTSVNVGAGFLKLASVITVDSTTNRNYPFGPVSVAQLFGGIMPRNWGLFVAHNNGAALSSTTASHFIKMTGVTYTVA